MKDDNGNEIQESIFNDIEDGSKYARNVKNARYWLFMLSAYWLVFGVVNYLRITNDADFIALKQLALYRLARFLVLGIVFLALALFSFKKASLSFLIAVLFYTALFIWLTVINTFNVQRIIIDILVILILIKGFTDAKKYEEITKTFGRQP